MHGLFGKVLSCFQAGAECHEPAALVGVPASNQQTGWQKAMTRSQDAPRARSYNPRGPEGFDSTGTFGSLQLLGQ